MPEGAADYTLTFEVRDSEGVPLREFGGVTGGWTAGERLLIAVRRVRATKSLECSYVAEDGLRHGLFFQDDPSSASGNVQYAQPSASIDVGWLIKGEPKEGEEGGESGVTIYREDMTKKGEIALHVVMRPR